MLERGQIRPTDSSTYHGSRSPPPGERRGGACAQPGGGRGGGCSIDPRGAACLDVFLGVHTVGAQRAYDAGARQRRLVLCLAPATGRRAVLCHAALGRRAPRLLGRIYQPAYPAGRRLCGVGVARGRADAARGPLRTQPRLAARAVAVSVGDRGRPAHAPVARGAARRDRRRARQRRVPRPALDRRRRPARIRRRGRARDTRARRRRGRPPRHAPVDGRDADEAQLYPAAGVLFGAHPRRPRFSSANAARACCAVRRRAIGRHGALPQAAAARDSARRQGPAPHAAAPQGRAERSAHRARPDAARAPAAARTPCTREHAAARDAGAAHSRRIVGRRATVRTSSNPGTASRICSV